MFSERLRLLRDARHMGQKELAADLQLSSSTISMYERGEREPKYATLGKIANYFGVSVDYLLGVTDIQSTLDEIIDPFPGLTPARRAEITTIVQSSGGSDEDARVILDYLSNRELLRKAEEQAKRLIDGSNDDTKP